MEKFSRTLGFCIGVCLINIFSIMIVANIAKIFLKDINGYIYILNCVGSFTALILLNSKFSSDNNKILSKDIFKKVEGNKIVYIILFGFGLAIFMSIIAGFLTELIPNYTNEVKEINSISKSYIDLLIIIVLGPIYEEILYRRVIFEYLKKNYNIVFAVIVQALIFGVVHGNIIQSSYAFILGIPLALVYMYSKSLLGSIVLHMELNLMCNILPYIADSSTLIESSLIILSIPCLILSIYKMILKDKKNYKNEYSK